MSTAIATELVSTNPATGEVIGSVPVTPVEAIGEIFERSHAAQSPWARLNLDERIEMLKRAISVLDRRAEQIGALITTEMGKTKAEGYGRGSLRR